MPPTSVEFATRWRGLRGEIMAGVETWRPHHPKASLEEIEAAVDERLAAADDAPGENHTAPTELIGVSDLSGRVFSPWMKSGDAVRPSAAGPWVPAQDPLSGPPDECAKLDLLRQRILHRMITSLQQAGTDSQVQQPAAA
jgi:hypothetical protein